MGVIQQMRFAAAVLLSASWWALGLPVAELRADGWHNAALATSSLDQWLNQNFSDLKTALPDLKQQVEAGEVRSGRDYQALEDRAKAAAGATAPKPKTGPGKAGTIQGNLNPQQQALMGQKSKDCLEILGCMNPDNIFPAEFPTFQMQQIPRYREAAKNLLKMMGPPGATAVTSQLRGELMGIAAPEYAGLTPHPNYISDLLEVLKEHIDKGTVSIQDLADLERAAAGAKTGRAANLAQETQKTLAEISNVSTLLKWAEEANDSKRRQQLYGRVRSKLKEAKVGELLAVIKSKADSATKDAATRELENRWSLAGPLELLQALDGLEDAQTRKQITAALAEKSPKYAEVKQDLPEIWRLARSNDASAAAGAKEQVANAFLRAPIPECLDWLAQGDTEINKLIWEQLDDRISRADAERKAGYREAAVAALADASQPQARRMVAIDFLTRLKDRQAAGDLIEMLTILPQEMRPRAGKLLRDLTGQNFGPMPGDGTAEVAVALKKWRDWWKSNGGK